MPNPKKTSVLRVAAIAGLSLWVASMLFNVVRGVPESAAVTKTLEMIYGFERATQCFVANHDGRFPEARDLELLKTLHASDCLTEIPDLRIANGLLSFLRVAHSGSGQTWGLTVACQRPQDCEMVWLSKASDRLMVGGTLEGVPCHGPPPAPPPSAGRVNLCFRVPEPSPRRSASP